MIEDIHNKACCSDCAERILARAARALVGAAEAIFTLDTSLIFCAYFWGSPLPDVCNMCICLHRRRKQR